MRWQPLASLFLFVALCLHSAQFVHPANTVITPVVDHDDGWGAIVRQGGATEREPDVDGHGHARLDGGAPGSIELERQAK